MTFQEGDSSPAIISDHAFRNMENPFGLCVYNGCNLARAAHEDPGLDITPHLSKTYRCANCIAEGEKVCTHGRS